MDYRDIFRDWIARTTALSPISNQRMEAATGLVTEICDNWDEADFYRQLPHWIGAHYQPHGWAWNGIYMQEGRDALALVAAHGPPVCSHLERSGGPGSSGMCWDAMELKQTIVVKDVKAWPGYVSCDGESGLGTVAGICVPLRNAADQVVGVWDLDATQELDPGDGPFIDRLLQTLSALKPLSAADSENS